MNIIQVSIILPAYNEENAIGVVIDDLKKVMNGNRYSHEIIVVDDASTDRTAEIAEAKGIKVIKHKKNKGSGASRKTGIKHAQGEIIVMLDADGTYSVEDIPKMLELFPEYDQVIGARTGEKGTFKFLRAPAKWLIQKLACYLTNSDIQDLNSGLRAFKKGIMEKYLWAIPDGFSCVSTMTLTFINDGYSVAWIPTEYHKRIGKSKFHPIKDSYNYLLTLIKMVMYFNPLKIFLPISFCLFGIGVLKSLYDRFWAVSRLQLSDVIIILTSVLVALLGLLADLIVIQGKR